MADGVRDSMEIILFYLNISGNHFVLVEISYTI